MQKHSDAACSSPSEARRGAACNCCAVCARRFEVQQPPDLGCDGRGSAGCCGSACPQVARPLEAAAELLIHAVAAATSLAHMRFGAVEQWS